MNAFFKKYGVDKNCPINKKYNSPAAELYREKVDAEIEGRSFQLPPPSAIRAPVKKAQGDDDWGSWDDLPTTTKTTSKQAPYSEDQLKLSMEQKESFFHRKMAVSYFPVS